MAIDEITISISKQKLYLQTDMGAFEWSVSTALKGAGQQMGSFCTPLGRHVVRAKVGGGAPLGSVFVARRETGEIYDASLALAAPERDWILTRILWLSGTEVGYNRFGNVDSMRRYIYIHGTPNSEPMGVPASHGCIRMRNDEVISLFDKVQPGIPVIIIP